MAAGRDSGFVSAPSGLLLIDTSVWIRSLRRRGDDRLKSMVREAMLEGRVATCAIVNHELLVGARDDAAFERLSRTLRALPQILVTFAVWDQAARLGHQLRRRGCSFPYQIW